MKKSKLLKIGSVVGIVILGVVGMTLLGSTEKESNKREKKEEARLVETLNVDFGNISLEVEGNGIIESQRTLDFISEANGQVNFAKNDLKDGTYAKKGEILVEVDSREVKNELYSLRSDFMNSVASIIPDLKIESKDVYQKWYNYFKSLDIEHQTPELPELTNSQEKIKVSSRNVLTKYYAVKNQEILVSKYSIRSPFDGYIKSAGVLRDSYVSRGNKLFTISDVKNLEIAVPLLVDEFNLVNFKSSPKVKIFAESDPDTYLVGKITRKDTKLERNSQSLNVYVTFRNVKLASTFLPGNYVKVLVDGQKLKDVASIPRHIIDNESRIYYMEDSLLQRADVEVVTMQGGNAIIKKTIPNQTQLVTTILQKPLVGMKIKTSADDIAVEEEIEDKEVIDAEGLVSIK